MSINVSNLRLCAVIVTIASLLSAPAAGDREHPFFMTLGAGIGSNIWMNGSIPYGIEVTAAKNLQTVRGTMEAAAAHLKARTCVNFFEMPTGWQGKYVRVRDTIAGSCSAGGTVLNYDGCNGNKMTVVHEMLHIVGIMHEQQRIDSYNKISMNEANIKPDFVDQYTPRYDTALGHYDWNSIMHYGNSYFNNGRGPTYDSTRTTFNVGCSTMSQGDIDTVKFLTQDCFQEPMRPRCKVSSPGTINIGTKFDQNISFTALYKREKLTATFKNLPEGAMAIDTKVYAGSVHKVWLRPTANDAGKEFNVTATFSTKDNQTVDCSTVVRVINSNYVCNGVPSNDPMTCSGHGACTSFNFPQCQCDAGYGGPFCEGLTSCPSDIIMDYELDQQGLCLVPNDHATLNRVDGPSGYAVNGTGIGLNFMRQVKRQPTEMSFLIHMDGVGDYYFSAGPVYFNMPGSKIGSVAPKKGWSFVQVVINYQFRTFTVFSNSFWALESRLNSARCADLSNEDCSVTGAYARVQSSTPNSSVMFDRLRVTCAATHITATADKDLAAATRMFHPISISLRAPHASYVWTAAAASAGLCTATDPQLLTGAAYSRSGNELNVTLPAVGGASQPFEDHYITCKPLASHFEPIGGKAAVVSEEAKVIGMKGFCQSGSVTYEKVKTRSFSQRAEVPPRPATIAGSVGFNPDPETGSSYEMRLKRMTTGSPEDFFSVSFNAKKKEMRINNYSNTNWIYHTVYQLNTEVLVDYTMTFDWSQKKVTISVFNESVVTWFNATALYRADFYYWENSPETDCTVTWTCPGTGSAGSNAVQVPQLYDPTPVTGNIIEKTPNLTPTGSESTPSPGGNAPSGGTGGSNGAVVGGGIGGAAPGTGTEKKGAWADMGDTLTIYGVIGVGAGVLILIIVIVVLCSRKSGGGGDAGASSSKNEPTAGSHGGYEVPEGDWVYYPEYEMYWSDENQMYFDQNSGQYFDEASGMWYDPNTGVWSHPSE